MATTNISAPTSSCAARNSQTNGRLAELEMRARERQHDRPHAVATVRIRVGDRASGGHELRFRLCRGGAGRQARKHIEFRTFPRAVFQGVQPKRNPELMVDGKREAVRHDADDRVKRSAELNRAADDVRIGVEPQPPRHRARSRQPAPLPPRSSERSR